MLFNGLFLLLRNVFFTSYIDSKNAFPKPLPKHEEEECIRLAKSGDRAARDKLIGHNLRLVAHIAKKYMNYSDQEDLISVGNIGLIKAINTYSPEKGNALVTYAARCIENEILMTLRASKKHSKTISIFDAVGRDKEGNEIIVAETLESTELSVFEQVESKIKGQELLKIIYEVLSPREYEIIKHRYGLGGGGPKTQKEISKALKISRSYVSRIEKKVLARIKQELQNKNIFL